VSMALSNVVTRYVAVGGVAAGSLVYWWQSRANITRETGPTVSV
jgi:hypothetical protein